MVKDLMDTLLENTLQVQLKFHKFEWHSIYRNVPRVVNFDVLGIQNTKCMLPFNGVAY